MTYLGPLHPVKAIERFREACKLLGQSSGPWHPSIAGSGKSGYTNLVQSDVAEVGLQVHADFLREVSVDAFVCGEFWDGRRGGNASRSSSHQRQGRTLGIAARQMNPVCG